MNYPVWDIVVSQGLLMAGIAIPHVFISHFAIGGGLYLVLAERRARRLGDGQRLLFVRRLSRIFVLLTLVLGALTGVAIWFIIGLLNPTATEALIHNFVWAWAAEWTLFFVEILAALLYYYGWDRVSPRRHLAIGWIYFGAAWASLFVINGIITFMLTPGTWLATGDVLEGFFNPTFWPSLVLRTGICITLAGLLTLAVASGYPWSPFKRRLVRENAAWGLGGLFIACVAFPWYMGSIPAEIIDDVGERLSITSRSLELLLILTVALGVCVTLVGLAAPRSCRPISAAVLILLGLGSFGSFEWFRESVRKPYVVTGYIYGNGIAVGDVERLRRQGLLENLAFRTGDDGADLFRWSCRSCHTLRGYNGLASAFEGTDPTFIAGAIRGLHQMRAKMPPFPGSRAESEILGNWIHRQLDQRSLAEITGLSGPELGRRSYETRCGICHVPGGHKDKTESLAGLEAEDLEALLEEELTEEMPTFNGGEKERKALVAYLLSLNTPGG